MAESHRPGPLIAPELTIDRLFDAPALAGPTILGLKISPDSTRVTYLQEKATRKDQLDLWEYDIREAEARMLVDSDRLATPHTSLSDEELSRRERQRTAALSGILEYSFAPSGRALLFPLGGELYVYDLTKSSADAVTKITHSQGFATDATMSPKGGLVAYVRDQNLYVYDLLNHLEKELTRDGAGDVKNGMAEFVAQEEMGRSTGYWWAPDDEHIAFARVDETPVEVVQRFEIAADNVTTFAQRYPAAGEPNAAIRLGVVNVHSGATRWIDLGAEPDIYLARVNWLPDGRTLAIQRQSRDQRRLDLLFADIGTGKSRIVLTETSDSWIELHDELTFLDEEFLWVSARDGFSHLYLYDYQGHLVRRLTAGDWCLDDFRARAIKAVDRKNRVAYVTGTAKSPTERHLYSVSLDSEDPSHVTRITGQDGVHNIVMAADTSFYADTFNSSDQPPQVSLYSRDGSLITHLIENRLVEGHPGAPYVSTNSEPEFGTLSAVDGQRLHYRLFKPLNFDPQQSYPAIIDVYGGPGVQRVVNGWTGSSFTQILTRAGYVVFQLDNRGTAGRGNAFQSVLRGNLGEVEVADQLVGAEWLGAQRFVDRSRIGVWGWSYGGYLALMLMFKAPDVFRAGISGAPVTDWTLYDTHYTERYLGKPQHNVSGYEASSVLPYAKDLRGDLLIMHGMADDNVLFVHSTKIFRRLQDLSKPFEIMVYPGAKHGLLRERDGRHAYATMLRFFDQQLRAR